MERLLCGIRHLLRRRWALTGILGVALLAGCGGGDPPTIGREYEEALRPLIARLRTLDDVNTDPKQVRSAARGFDDAAARIRRLEPPGYARNELAAVVDALEDCADALRIAGKPATVDERKARSRARTALAAGVRRFREADRTFRAALGQ